VTSGPEESAPRAVTGWKAALVAVTLIVVVFSILNLLARPDDEERDGPLPSPSIVTASPR
jgi:hypothetical protein